jgi:hypothetical protein
METTRKGQTIGGNVMCRQALLALAAFLAIAVMTVAGQTTGALSLTNVSVSPNPVMAGGNATIRFQIYNSYNFWLFNVNLQPTGSYPLINVSPLSSYHLGQIGQGSNPGYFNYTISIPKTTPSGVYTLTFTATYYALTSQGVAVSTSSMPLSFYVQNKPTIKLVALSPQPASLYAGHNQTIEIGIENAGYGTARNVSVSVSAGPGASILSSVTGFFVSNLTQGQVVEEPVLVSAQSTSSAGLLANVTYYSSDLRQRFHSAQNLSLSVAPAAQFNVTGESSGIVPGSTDVPLTFTVRNIGTMTAQELQLSLQSTYPLTPVASTYYVASLTPGASTNVTFLVSADSQGVPSDYPVTIYEQWKQPNGATNQQFSGSNNYFVVVNPTSGVSVADMVAAVVIIAIVGFIVIRKRKAKRVKEKAKGK